jgi:K+/H+ antiporter YhaU regulatory subunit KhtT
MFLEILPVRFRVTERPDFMVTIVRRLNKAGRLNDPEDKESKDAIITLSGRLKTALKKRNGSDTVQVEFNCKNEDEAKLAKIYFWTVQVIAEEFCQRERELAENIFPRKKVEEQPDFKWDFGVDMYA